MNPNPSDPSLQPQSTALNQPQALLKRENSGDLAYETDDASGEEDAGDSPEGNVDEDGDGNGGSRKRRRPMSVS